MIKRTTESDMTGEIRNPLAENLPKTMIRNNKIRDKTAKYSRRT